MKRIVLILAVLFLAGCSLSDDVTPPPALATAQAIQPASVATSDSAGLPPVASASESLEPPSTEPDLASGQTIYLDKCIQCHGPVGMGDGDMVANLESPPPALGDPDIARQAVPADWYTTVTQGRMENFMPPFTSLSDQERWDVTGFLLSLGLFGEDLDSGEELFAANCAECHRGDNAVGGLLVDPAKLVSTSRQDLSDLISTGVPGMPGFGDQLDQGEIFALAAYIQALNLGWQADGVDEVAITATPQVSPEAEATEAETIDQPAEGTTSAEPTGEAEPSEEPAEDLTPTPTESLVGIIQGQVIQGTFDAEIPQGLTAQLLGIEGNTIVVDEEAPIGPDGSYRFENLEAVTGRIYAVVIEYQGVPYFSEGVHLLAGEPVTNLPVTIHEVTRNTDQLLVERVHLIADPSPTGQLIFTELWLVVNVGDRTIFDPEGGVSMQITLPEGFTDLEFFEESALQRYQVTDNGFNYTGSIVPGFENELVFSFTLDFDSRLDFEQPVDYPVGAVVALVTEGILTLSGDEVVDRGPQDMGGTPLRTYNLPAVEAGQAISFRIRSAASSGGESGVGGLVIGLAALGVGLLVAGLLWYRRSRAGAEIEPSPQPEKASIKRDQLLRQIADLDDAFEAGEIDASSYEQQRARLKDEVRRLMQADE